MWAGARDNAPAVDPRSRERIPAYRRRGDLGPLGSTRRPDRRNRCHRKFFDTRRFTGPLLTPDADGTGRIRLTGLPADSEVHYRVTLDADGALSEPATGVFRTAPATTATSD